MLKTSRKYAEILGVKVGSTHKAGVLRELRGKIARGEKFFIVTPNPEIVIEAQKDKELFRILNSADISIADGIGLCAAYKFLKLPRQKGFLKKLLTFFIQGLGVAFLTFFDKTSLTKELPLIKGRELFLDLIAIANKKSWKVILLGDKLLSAQKAAFKLKLNYKKVRIHGLTGPDLDKRGTPLGKTDKNLQQRVIEKINKFKPELLFVGFGAPKQEKWVYKNFANLNIGGAMVVGGTFDFISGKSVLPPKIIEDRDLEWLWRIAVGHQNLKRVRKAFPEFPARIFFEKLKE